MAEFWMRENMGKLGKKGEKKLCQQTCCSPDTMTISAATRERESCWEGTITVTAESTSRKKSREKPPLTEEENLRRGGRLSRNK